MKKNDIKSNWNRMVSAYENFTSSGSSYSNLIEWPAIQTLLPDLKDKKVLDLGCGTGRFAFKFERYSPATILGIDISEEMVKSARKIAYENHSSAAFIEGDIEDLSQIEESSFDFVFSSTALHYLESLEKISSEIFRVLKPKGVCVLSLIHPLYSAHYPILSSSFEGREWKLRYLDKNIRSYVQPWIQYNSEIENFTSQSYHHTISDYINSFVQAGLSIKSLLEPMPPKSWKSDNIDRYKSCMNTPIYAIFKVEKA